MLRTNLRFRPAVEPPTVIVAPREHTPVTIGCTVHVSGIKRDRVQAIRELNRSELIGRTGIVQRIIEAGGCVPAPMALVELSPGRDRGPSREWLLLTELEVIS